jgi:hypothetical protein
MEQTNIVEGNEYRITCNGRTIFEGIAESDSEAEERLESYALQISARNNSTTTIKLRIIKL